MSSKFTNRRGGEEDRTKSVGYDTRIIRTSSDVITCKYGPPFSIFDFEGEGRVRTPARGDCSPRQIVDARSPYYTYRIGYWRRRPIDHPRYDSSRSARLRVHNRFPPLFARGDACLATWKPRISHVSFPSTSWTRFSQIFSTGVSIRCQCSIGTTFGKVFVIAGFVLEFVEIKENSCNLYQGFE